MTHSVELPACNTGSKNNTLSASLVSRAASPFLNIDQMNIADKAKTSFSAQFNNSLNIYNSEQNFFQAIVMLLKIEGHRFIMQLCFPNHWKF